MVEHVEGSTATDFGVPSAVAVADAEPLTKAGATRLASLVAASWQILDDVVAGAPSTLRKGPRGGGRDRDAIATHVLEAEAAYARKLGLRWKAATLGDAATVAEHREAILDVLRRPSGGSPVDEKGWPPRYAARRIAWHALDHAWEIEDKSEPRRSSRPGRHGSAQRRRQTPASRRRSHERRESSPDAPERSPAARPSSAGGDRLSTPPGAAVLRRPVHGPGRGPVNISVVARSWPRFFSRFIQSSSVSPPPGRSACRGNR